MDITAKLWSYCHILRHDGVDSADYVEQLTYLLFLKMAEEKGLDVPKEYNWQSLLSKDKEDIGLHLNRIFHQLGSQKGMLRLFFLEPYSRIESNILLKKIIAEINTQTWTNLDKDTLEASFKKAIGEDFKKQVETKLTRFIEKFEVMKNISLASNGTRKVEELMVTNYKRLPKKIAKEDILEEGKYPIISQSHQEIIGYTNEQNALFNHLPIIAFGDHTRVIKYIDYPFAIYGDGVRLIIPNTNMVLAKYLFYALKAAYIPDLGYSRHFFEVKKLNIFVPSIDEQRKIVENLDKQFNSLEKEEKQIEQKQKAIQARRNSLFQEFFSNQLNIRG
jgi:hypothetical protein